MPSILTSSDPRPTALIKCWGQQPAPEVGVSRFKYGWVEQSFCKYLQSSQPQHRGSKAAETVSYSLQCTSRAFFLLTGVIMAGMWSNMVIRVELISYIFTSHVTYINEHIKLH